MDLTGDYATLFGNQIIAKAKDGYSEASVAKVIEDYLAENEITVKSSSLGNNLPYRVYMKSVLKQLNVATMWAAI